MIRTSSWQCVIDNEVKNGWANSEALTNCVQKYVQKIIAIGIRTEGTRLEKEKFVTKEEKNRNEKTSASD